MRNPVLGIDTSNYRTSAAAYDPETGEYQNCGRLLDVPAGAIGLRQSDALFQHTLHLHEQVGRLPEGLKPRAVGVSTRPRAVEGSYMPCFLAGENAARTAAQLLGVPLFPCSHQQGHLAAAALSAGQLRLLDGEFLAWHLSGGTSELLHVRAGADGLPDAERIGGTTDLAAGQLIDRCGQLLGLAFPAGAALDRLQQGCTAPVKAYRPKVKDCEFSLSGMQNQVEALAKKGAPPETVARFTVETILNAVAEATAQALAQAKLPVLCAGGVMSCTLLQERLSARFGCAFATPELSGDNAVGAAVLAARQRRGSAPAPRACAAGGPTRTAPEGLGRSLNYMPLACSLRRARKSRAAAQTHRRAP